MSDSKRDEHASPDLGSAPAESLPGKSEDGTEQIPIQEHQHKRKEQVLALHNEGAGWPLQQLEVAVCEPPLDTRSIAASRDEHLATVAHARASAKQHCLVHHSQSAAADAAAVAAHEAQVSSLQAAAAAQAGKGIGDMSLGLALSPAVAELHSSSTECAAADAEEALAAATTIAAATALCSSTLRHSIQNSADTSESSACLGCQTSSSPTAAALLARIGRLPYSSLAQFSSSPPGFRQAATLRWPPDSAVPEAYPAETILHQPCDLDSAASQTYSSPSAQIYPHGHQQATDPASQPKAEPTDALKSASHDITAVAGITAGGAAAATAATASSRHASTGKSLRQLSASTSRTASILTAGGIAGAISRTATAPVDRLKMLMQINDSGPRLTIRTAFRAMAAEGSLHAFFRGNGANVLKIAPETALKLTFNDKLKGLLVADLHNIRPHERMFVGALAGASAQAIIYPLELIRTRLAVSPVGHYHGIMHCLALVLQQEGWHAFYRGLLPCMIGILPYSGVDIATFEILKQRLLETHDGRPPPPAVFAAGMLSSCVAQCVSYPLALIRTRLQAQGVGGAKLKYNGMLDVIRKTIAHEGVLGLYKGILPNLIKVAPAAGISWFTFEEVKKVLGVDVNT